MPKVFLTPFLLTSLFLLPGCSNSAEIPEKPEAKAECDEVKETYGSFTKLAEKYPYYTREYETLNLARHYYLLENNSCFTSIEVATTKAAIDVFNARNKK